jgi:hypothetical protein
LRHAEQSAGNELSHSPRLSEDSLMADDHRNGIEIVYDETEDIISDVVSTSDDRSEHYSHHLGAEDPDGETEDVLDDDMMDKISSSPSIDDGGKTL